MDNTSISLENQTIPAEKLGVFNDYLSRVFYHTTKKYLKGFRMLTLGWTDGNSFLGVDFALLSSAHKKNRYNEINTSIDKRTCGYRRREEAIKKSTELLEPMIKRAINSATHQYYLHA